VTCDTRQIKLKTKQNRRVEGWNIDVTMITIIDVDINKWCKSYRKTSLSKSQTSI